jgi:ABC transporter with metal-binding/Fe-S-binding domain ATP-binding protein
MKLAALFSGGKDSTFAIMEAIKAGHEIKYLITMAPQRDDSYMFHYPCVDLTRMQAEAMGIKQVWKETEGTKEDELVDLRAAVESVKGEIEGILSGAVSSQYQKMRIDGICRQLNLESVTPLWGMDAYDLLKAEAESMEIMITAVSTNGLDKGWLGRRISTVVVEELRMLAQKVHFNIQFEGGEAETFVMDCPLFSRKIVVGDYDKVWDTRTSSGYIRAKNVKMVPKKI